MSNVSYKEFRPAPALTQFVECFWHLTGSANCDPEPPEQILPDGRSEMIFNLADPMTNTDSFSAQTTRPRGYYVGQILNSISLKPQGIINLFGVSFHPCGAFPFFNLPQKELTEQSVGIDILWGHSSEDIDQKIIAATSISQRISLIENFLIRRLTQSSPFDNRSVCEAVRRIFNAAGQVQIGDLADSLGVSRRRLEKQFAHSVGVSPKSLARIIRFQNIFRVIDNHHALDWANTAATCGYYDQPHLINDFRNYCGQSPTRYFREKHDLSKHFRSDHRGAHSYNTI